MKQKRIIFILLLLFLTTSILLFNCSKNEENSNQIVIKYMRWANPAEVQSTKELLKLFMKKNPDIKVIFEHEGWGNYWDKLQTQMAANTGPDVFLLGAYFSVDFYKKGILLNLQPFIDKDKNFNKKDYFSPPFKLYTFNGNLYALPRDINSIVLYYNKDLFDRAGVKYPTDNWTWNDLVKAAKKLTMDYNNDGIIDQWGIMIPNVFEVGWGNLILQNNGSILNKNKTESTLTNPEVVQAIQFMVDLEYKYKVAPLEKSKGSLGDNIFMTGKVAMIYDGSWMIGTYKTIKSFKWDIVMLPRGKKRACIANGVANAINSHTKHKEAAWKLVKFLSSREAQIAVAKSGTSIPILKNIAYSKYYLDGTPPNKIACLKSIKYGHNYPTTSEMKRWLDDIIVQEMDLILLQQESVKEGLEKAKKRVDKILKEIENN